MEKVNLSEDEKYMLRCLQLANNAKGYVSPNPMVGAVVVNNGKIIGEGFHRQYGKPHAEVNAINSVIDKSLLANSTIYVSLEPCSHYGKTPPCSQLIIDSKIPKVVVATLDPYFKVSGRGIEMLKKAGIEVVVGILDKEAQMLNKEFFIAQTQNRPYIYLKWAQTKDGFIDKLRLDNEPKTPTPISNSSTRILVHKFRSEVDSIMIATNTTINDNPSLTTRYWFGKNPTRIVLDRLGRVPSTYKLFDNSVDTLVFTQNLNKEKFNNKTHIIQSDFDKKMIPLLLKELNERKINSVLIEGGATLLKNLILSGIWDEACIEVANKTFSEGVCAPKIEGAVIGRNKIGGSEIIHLKNVDNYKIL